jgi:flavin-dependent dehydrogenase
MSPTRECDVAVVGGGLAGPAAALAFAQQGCSINTTTIAVAHFQSELAGPGQEAYERALDFFGRAATDPDFVRGFHAQFGGGE